MSKSIVPVLSIKNVSKQFGQSEKVLNDINLEIYKNEFVCLLGPSGCGKSTLLNLAAGFLKPDSGICEMNGRPIEQPDSSRGVVFQTPTLYPWLTVEQNIGYGLKIRKIEKSIRQEKVAAFMAHIQLKDYAKSYPFELSGGMKQRVALARTLINEPEIILMDEPFSALDALTKADMQVFTRNLWQESKQTFFMITHDIEEALKLGTRIIVMKKHPGEFVLQKSTDYTFKIINDSSYAVENDAQFQQDKLEILSVIN